jgi:hypothetical protein
VDAAVCRLELDLDSDSENEMSRIIEELSQSESGCLDYAWLVREFGFKIVRQMIDLDILFYHATKSISGDLNMDPWRPIVTARSVPCLRAMQRLTKRLKSYASGESDGVVILPPE